MRKFLHIFLSMALIVLQYPVSAFVHVAEAAEDLPTYSNPMNGAAGANFTGAINWLKEENAFATVQPVTVAILDDGVDVSNPYIDENAFLTEECKSFIPGESSDTALKPPSYSDGHGTTMASVIGGKNGLGALSGVSGVNYISYRYYEYNDEDGDPKLNFNDDAYRSQLIAALNSLYEYATTNDKGNELKVALITGAMSRYVAGLYDTGEYVSGFDPTRPRYDDTFGTKKYFYNNGWHPMTNPEDEHYYDSVIAEDLKIQTAMQNLHNIGVSIVVAEDNPYSNITAERVDAPVACPAYFDGALAVTAVNQGREIAEWPDVGKKAGYSPHTDIAGYGSVNNTRDWWVAVSGVNVTSSHVSKTSGTSIAAAQVAAAIALTAKAGCVGKQGTDWSGTDAEYRIMQVLNNLEGTRSPFNGAQGVLDVYSVISTYAEGTHYHTFAKDWAFDESGHWHKCISESCDNQANIKNFAATEFAEHTFGSDNKCTVCGYEKKTPETPEADLEIDIPQDIPGNFEVLVNGQPAGQGTKVKEGDSLSVRFSTTKTEDENNPHLYFVNKITVNGNLIFSLKDYDKSEWNRGDFDSILENLQKNKTVDYGQIENIRDVDKLDVSIEVQELVPVFRLYKHATGEHLFTPLKEEYYILSEVRKDWGWEAEGIDWLSATGTGKNVRVQRFYNREKELAGSMCHYYTSEDNEYEIGILVNSGWVKEDANTFYNDGDIAIYKAYHDPPRESWHYTSNLNEYRNYLYDWNKEPRANGFSSDEDIKHSVGRGFFKCVMSAR